jgi:hypothetical protein
VESADPFCGEKSAPESVYIVMRKASHVWVDQSVRKTKRHVRLSRRSIASLQQFSKLPRETRQSFIVSTHNASLVSPSSGGFVIAYINQSRQRTRRSCSAMSDVGVV